MPRQQPKAGSGASGIRQGVSTWGQDFVLEQRDLGSSRDVALTGAADHLTDLYVQKIHARGSTSCCAIIVDQNRVF